MAMSRTRKIALIVTGILGALVLVALIGVAVIYAIIRRGEPTIRDNSVLTLRIGGELPDYVPDDPFRRILGGPDQSLTGLLLQFKKAKVDKRIAAILLDIDMSGIGWAKAEELRDAIADFRSSGKPIYGFMEFGLNKEYYIASACDRVYLAPPGELFTIGLAADVMFFRGSLDKLGIYPDMYQIGKYKNAGDTFTRKEMSEEHREAVNSLLDDLYQRYVQTIAQARGKSADEVRSIIDNAPYGATQAKEIGLIDGALFRDGVEKELKSKLGYKDSDDLAIARGSEYRNVNPESLGLNKGERIAIIYGTGNIGSGRSENSPTGDQSIGSDTMSKAIRDAAEDKTVKAIVLRVDSPGGSGLASDIIWHAVESAKQKKPVVVSMSDVAASGGYYISVGAHKIIAQPSTITGSIGVVAGKPVVKGLYDWLGVSNEYVLRGKNSGMFRETEKFSDSERQKFQEWINSTYYDQFLPKVARGRNKESEYVDSVGQGRVWTGSQARERGLVDEFGGLEKAVEMAKELAKIPADKGVQRVIFPYPRTFLQQIFSGGGDDPNAKTEQQKALIAAMPEDLRRAFNYLSLLEQMKNGELMYLMPFDIRIR